MDFAVKTRNNGKNVLRGRYIFGKGRRGRAILVVSRWTVPHYPTRLYDPSSLAVKFLPPPPPPKTMWSPQVINNDCSLKERGETSFAIKNAEAWVLFHRQWHQSLPGPTITLHCYPYVITSDWLKNSYWKTTLIFLEKFLASKFICPCSLIVL